MKNVLCILLLVFIAFPVKAETDFHLKLFITVNLQGWWNSKDFYPQSKKKGLAFLIKDIQKKKQDNPKAILLDAGDFFYGSARSFYSFQQLSLEKNLFLKNFLNLNYDLVNLGNLDLRNLDILEQILVQKKLNLISANFKHSSTQNYKIFSYRIFYRGNKKIFITALSYPEFSLSDYSSPQSSWRFLHWKKSLQQVQKNIKKEKPDFVIGIFHLSKFFSPSGNIPSLEHVVTYFPNWDLLVSSQGSRTNSKKNISLLERIHDIPLAIPATKGAGWLELNISLKDKKITAISHEAQYKKTIEKDGFSKYLQHSTSWRYKGGTDYKRCLEYSFAKAVQGKKLVTVFYLVLGFNFFLFLQEM